MSHEDKSAFFDSIAPKWDGFEDLDALAEKFDAGLASFGVRKDEHVLDVGCGTGNLTRALLRRLSFEGSVTAVDISVEMVKTARKKISDARVTWHVADAAGLAVSDGVLDRVICCAVWPHFEDHAAVLKEFRRVLRPAGILHIWHLSSRRFVNEIHASAGAAVQNDVLAPIEETRAMLEDNAFQPFIAEEDDSRYLVSAIKMPVTT